MKTVKEVSEISGVSIRTLRYYDEIGLLKPTQLTEAGYRLYDNHALEKLQQIMFFRELEIPLADIREILENSDFNREHVLSAQKSLLEKKRNHLNGIIELITDVMKGVNTMNFEAFNENDAKKVVEILQTSLSEEDFQSFVAKYGDGSVEKLQEVYTQNLQDEKIGGEILKWFGSKDKVMDSMKPVENMDQHRKEYGDIHRQLAELKDTGNTEAERELVAMLADSYKVMLSLDNARAFLMDLAKEYLENKQLAEANDKQYGEGSAEYIARAIQRYYGV